MNKKDFKTEGINKKNERKKMKTTPPKIKTE